MDLSPVPYYSESGRLFYKMYHNLPIGAVLVNADMTVISSNKRMCEYFSGCGAGPEGMPLGKAIHCGNIEKETSVCGEAEACKECKLRNGVMQIIKEKLPVNDLAVKYTYCPQNAKVRKWFKVSGFHIEYGNETYAVLFSVTLQSMSSMKKILKKRLS